MKASKSEQDSQQWQKTPVANLVRNAASGSYYARVRVAGKLIWKTTSLLWLDFLSDRKLAQPFPNRRGQVFNGFFHAIASRYGFITRATRQTSAHFQSSSMENLFFRQPSRSASSATSRPILFRYPTDGPRLVFGAQF
jgi:hypothetical protein